jgi:hypothetical protein
LLRQCALAGKSSCNRETPKISDQLASGKHIALLSDTSTVSLLLLSARQYF